METKNSTYLILTIILVILSGVGIFFLIRLPKNNSSANTSSSKINLIPTDVIRQETITPTVIPTIEATTSTTKVSTSSSATVSSKTKTTPTPTTLPKITITPTATPTSATTPSILDFASSKDGFSISYNSGRKVYQDTESSGNRYTFYSISGNFAVHVGLDGKWAWTNPSRKFTSDLLIANQSTFKYDTSTQTIIDLQSNNKNYTIQCVHNGKESLKTECESFYRSFKLN